MHKVHLSLGTNEGDRESNISKAISSMAEAGIEALAISNLFETSPVGEVTQGAFLNCAVVASTSLPPNLLLLTLKRIEQQLGRRATYRWGPRVIDIDIILYDELQLNSDELTIPHPRFRERRFVLAPLAEIARDTVDPATGKTVAELLAEPGVEGEVHSLSIKPGG